MKLVSLNKFWIAFFCLLLGLMGTILVSFGIPATQQLMAGNYHFESWRIVPAPASDEPLPARDPNHFDVSLSPTLPLS